HMTSTLFPYTTLFRSEEDDHRQPPGILAREIHAPVVVDEDAEVVPIQIRRDFLVLERVLGEVLAPVTPHGADQEKDGFPVSLCDLERLRRIVEKTHPRRLMGVGPHDRDRHEDEDAEDEGSEQLWARSAIGPP